MRRLATIDLGTNTIRLLVVEVAGDGTWVTLAGRQALTRLGEGLEPRGALSEQAMDRSVETVAKFCREAKAFKIAEVVIVATSAVRRASNRQRFVDRVQEATGEAVRVISGEDEARLALQGALHSLPHLTGRVVLFDIGGGSTEIILSEDGRLMAVQSLALGVVPLAERFLTAGPVDWERYAEMDREIRDTVAEELTDFSERGRPHHVVGTAGTLTTLAALAQGLSTYAPERVQGYRLHHDRIQALLGRLGALPVAARASLPCLEPGRADLIIPGIAICLATMERFGSQSVVVSDFGLREGILIDHLNRVTP